MAFGFGGYDPHASVSVTGSSPNSFSEAAQDGVQKAAAGLGLRAWEIIDSYQVVREYGTVSNGIMTFEADLLVLYKSRGVFFER
jgi:flavin-binding protein dodecin